jgi:hypothetical protein
MRWIGIACVAAMALTGVGVGVRLLGLARRTGGFPELAVGLGLVLVTVVGGPLAALGRVPGWVATPTGDLVFAAGLASIHAGIALFLAFTWRVFRPTSGWARVMTIGGTVVLAGLWFGLVTASARGDTMEAILPHTRPWGLGVVATVALVFSWSAAESLLRHALLRRRLRLGLADPVVANRFLLWGVSGVATVVLCASVVASMLAGLAPMRHPIPLASIALAAVLASIGWLLAFLPPRAYLDRLRARAAAGAAQ